MLTTSNSISNDLASLLVAHGVRHVVVSPGSRNAAPILACDANPGLTLHAVVDERSAAFMALGITLITSEPTALICTSGSALYNYAPAVAEAYYRRLPLIVISADRPHAWIGQDDSQTLEQPGALRKIVKGSYSLMGPSEYESSWYNSREINDALLTAISSPCGPVHINLPIEYPFHKLMDYERVVLNSKKIELELPDNIFTIGRVRILSKQLASPRRIMIVVGFIPPENILRKALLRLAALPNIVVVGEHISNLGRGPWIIDAEQILSLPPESDILERLRPDVILTIGGGLVSGIVKSFLRHSENIEHWYIGESTHLIDCYRHLTKHIPADPGRFMQLLASAMQIHKRPSDYSSLWHRMAKMVRVASAHALRMMPWGDLTAFREIIRMLPVNANLQLSNGMTVRYTQMTGEIHCHRIDCNRGVSGIDGSTSTSIGASLAYSHGPTILISGDMSALYDISGLFSGQCDKRFKMIIIDNGGGEIFRIIESTRNMPITSGILSATPKTDWMAIAKAAGFKSVKVNSVNSLREGMQKLLTIDDAPALLIVDTSESNNAALLRCYRLLLSANVDKLKRNQK